MKIKIVTNCTARKAVPAPQALRARSLPKGTVTSLAKEWGRRLAAADKRVPAAELYQGRAFQEAMRAARLAQTPLYIVSAGLGLITERDAVPAYSLTVSDANPDAVSRRIDSESGFRIEKWWGALRRTGIRTQGLTECIRRSRDTLFVLALSPVYLGLVTEDLLRLSTRDLNRVRLVGPRREADIPEALRYIHMPYDDRLDGVRSPIRGTESDFPQRAALHLVRLVLTAGGRATPQAHQRLVETALKTWPRKRVIKRAKLSEAALRQTIDRVLRECDDRWSRALRKLRDQRKVACEQKRFRRICSELLDAKG